MERKLLGFGLIALLLGCGDGASFSGGGMDWRLFRGDAALSGYTVTRLPKRPALLWTYKSDARTVSSPVVHQGVTYWSNNRGRIMGVDLNGELIFDYDMQTAVSSTPMISDSTLYIGRIDGFLTAISLTQKEVRWEYETMGQVSASPNTGHFEGRRAVVFGSYDNFLYVVDAADGTEINRFESGYYLNGAVALQDKYAVFGGCDSWLRIIDCETGIQTDSLLLDAYIPASPAMAGAYCYVGDYSGNIYEIHLEKGKIISHQKISEADKDNDSYVSVPAVTKDALYFLSDSRYLYSVDRKKGTVNWRYMLKGNAGESSPVVCKDKILVCTKTGIITIIDAAKGEAEWEYDAGEPVVASPAVIKDHFMILSDKGTLFCFGAKK